MSSNMKSTNSRTPWSVLALVVATINPKPVAGFHPTFIPASVAAPHSLLCLQRRAQHRLYSSVGDGTPRPPGDDDEDYGMGDFLKPKNESESLQRAREYMSETSLPLSFDIVTDEEKVGEEVDNDDVTPAAVNENENDSDMNNQDNELLIEDPSSSSEMVMSPATSSNLFGTGDPTPDMILKNQYIQVVSRFPPSELIAKFTSTAPARVQEAVRTTILGLIGSLPKMEIDTTTITTGQRLASLMFQLQMTGYMFKNAEYRLSLSQSLGTASGSTAQSSNFLLAGDVVDEHDDEKDPLLTGKIRGKVKIRYGTGSSASGEEETNNGDNVPKEGGLEVEVDAAAYMSELRNEVSRLKDELTQTRKAKDEALRQDLLLYIRTLPKQELQSLTNTMSQDVLVSMKGLVQVVLSGIGDGKIDKDTVTEQSGEAMAQLCMWQMAVGYNLRELEVREEMKKSLSVILGGKEGGVDLSEPGSME
jgi:hypothetical protein